MADDSLISPLSSDIDAVVLLGLEKADFSQLLNDKRSFDLVLKRIDSQNSNISDKARKLIYESIYYKLVNDGFNIERAILEKEVQILKRVRSDIGALLAKEISQPKSLKRAEKLLMLTFAAPDSAARILNGAHFDPDPRFRATAAKLHLCFNEVDLQARIMKFLSDADSRVISNAIEALDTMRNSNLSGVLARFRSHKNPRVKSVTIKALSRLGERDLNNDIKSIIEDGREACHSAIAWLLPEIPSIIPDPLPILTKLTKSSSIIVKGAALRSLKKIGSSSAISIISGMEAVDIIEKDREARELLHHILADSSRLEKIRAIKNAANAIDSGSFSSLLPFLDDPSPSVVAAAIAALEPTAHFAQVVNAIKRLSDSKNGKVRAFALRALHNSGCFPITKEIESMIADSNDTIRGAGVWLAGEIGTGCIYFAELINKTTLDGSRFVNINRSRAQRKLLKEYSMGKRSAAEAVAEEALRSCIDKPASFVVQRERFVKSVSDRYGYKQRELDAIMAKLAEFSFCSIDNDSFGMERIVFTEWDIMDLYLFYCQGIRTGEASAWHSLSQDALAVLQNMTYLAQKHGRMIDHRTFFPIKEFGKVTVSGGKDIAASISELVTLKLCELIEEDGCTMLSFRRERLLKVVKIIKWLPLFQKIVILSVSYNLKPKHLQANT